MAVTVLAAAGLRTTLPAALRARDASWLLGGFVIVILIALVIGDSGRIDRQATWLGVLTDLLIGGITLVNAASAAKLVADIVNTEPFTNNAKTLLAAGGAIWLTNVIAFGLWYWDLVRGGAKRPALMASARRRSSSRR